MAAITPNFPASLTQSSSAPKQTKAEEQKSQFLKILVAQLKGQNPLDPQDGAEFISQLTQFSSLEELINVRTELESITKNTTLPAASNPFQDTKE